MHNSFDCGDVMEHLPIPVIICKPDGVVVRCNRSAETIFDLEGAGGSHISAIMPDLQWDDVLREKSVTVIHEGVPFNLCVDRGKNFYIVSCNTMDASFAARRELSRKRDYTSRLSALFDHYIEENIWVTDGTGKTVFVSAAIAQKYEKNQKDFIGRYVQDLEREKVFFPSATVEVLKTGRQSALLQQTKDGRLCVAVGIPSFDASGKIQRVLSLTRDCASQIELVDTLLQSEVHDALPEENDLFARRFITRDPVARKMLQVARLAAPSDSTILIEGESGVGKSILAEAIHEASNRAGRPFLSVNCAVIPDSLFDSELFGYTSGSFTGADAQGKAGLIETAQGGTLFLDEIEEMSLPQQVKLLTMIQERTIRRIGGTGVIPVDVRIICATKKKLEDLVAAKRFREDLFYRLHVVCLNIPPLRERRDDIALLVKHICARINENYGINKFFSQAAIEKLACYEYPGNVRELAHALERAMVTTQSRRIDVADLPEKIRAGVMRDDMDDVAVQRILPLDEAVDQAEKQLLRLALDTSAMKEDIASALEVSKATLWRKLQKYGLTREKNM